jgi:hypothetical protein
MESHACGPTSPILYPWVNKIDDIRRQDARAVPNLVELVHGRVHPRRVHPRSVDNIEAAWPAAHCRALS